MYVSGIGLVWGGVQLLVLTVQGQPLILDPQTLSFGLAAGLMVLLSNLLLIESLTHLDVSNRFNNLSIEHGWCSYPVVSFFSRRGLGRSSYSESALASLQPCYSFTARVPIQTRGC